MRSRWIKLAAIVVAIGAIVGCSSDGDSSGDDQARGRSRQFMMGTSSLPRELNAESYADTFRLAEDAGELILIQRSPPWADFLPGGSVSTGTADTTAAEVAAVADHDLTLFFAIDPMDAATGRDRIGGLPPTHEGQTFEDGDIRAAFASYAEYVAINYRPRYLALGVEMNLYFQRDPGGLEPFESLYRETYDRVKAAAPDTQVTLTFQFEDMQSLLPTEDRHFPDWPLIQQFQDKMDVMAISTYPSFAFSRAEDIPANYYSQLRGFTDAPIVIAEMGFASETNGDGLNDGSEPEQAAFVQRALSEADKLEMPFVVWFAGWDPAYAEGTAFSAFESIGLLRVDGSEKPAWDTWKAAADLPLAGE